MKKVISLLLAIIMVTSVLTVNVSASTDSMTREEWRLQSKWKVPYQYQHCEIEKQFEGQFTGNTFYGRRCGCYVDSPFGNYCSLVMFSYIFSAMTGRVINIAEYTAAREAYDKYVCSVDNFGLWGLGEYPSKTMAEDLGFYIRQIVYSPYFKSWNNYPGSGLSHDKDTEINTVMGAIKTLELAVENTINESEKEKKLQQLNKRKKMLYELQTTDVFSVLYPEYEGEKTIKKDIDFVLDNNGIVGVKIEGSELSGGPHFFVITEHNQINDTYKLFFGTSGKYTDKSYTFEQIVGENGCYFYDCSTPNLIFAYNPNISSVSFKSDVKIGEIQGDWRIDAIDTMIKNTSYNHLYGYLASVEYPNVPVVYTEGMDLEEENTNGVDSAENNNDKAIYNLSKVYITSPKYGKEVEVEVEMYKIGENNYIKLRDIAYLLNESKNQFDVSWNGVENAIELTSFKGYADYNKSELHTVTILKDNQNIKSDNDKSNKIYILSDSSLMKDKQLVKSVKYKNIEGKLVETDIVGYNIDGANYYKLRDIGRLFNFDVDWKNKSIYIETDLPYTDD